MLVQTARLARDAFDELSRQHFARDDVGVLGEGFADLRAPALDQRTRMRSATSSPASLRAFCRTLTNSRAMPSRASAASSAVSSTTVTSPSVATTAPASAAALQDHVGERERFARDVERLARLRAAPPRRSSSRASSCADRLELRPARLPSVWKLGLT